MCGRSIRRLAGDERAAQEERDDEHYAALFDEVEAQMVAENILDGGACDYKPDGARVHQKVLSMMRK